MKCEKHSFGPWRSNADQMGALTPSADGVTYQYSRECTIMGCSFVEQAKDVVPVRSKTQAKRIAATEDQGASAAVGRITDTTSTGASTPVPPSMPQTETHPTPRTDALIRLIAQYGVQCSESKELAPTTALVDSFKDIATLEREAAALQARLDEAERDLVYRQEKIAEQHRALAEARIEHEAYCLRIAEQHDAQLAEARAKERERCAKVMESERQHQSCADAIRALTDEAQP